MRFRSTLGLQFFKLARGWRIEFGNLYQSCSLEKMKIKGHPARRSLFAETRRYMLFNPRQLLSHPGVNSGLVESSATFASTHNANQICLKDWRRKSQFYHKVGSDCRANKNSPTALERTVLRNLKSKLCYLPYSRATGTKAHQNLLCSCLFHLNW